jgi:hypothetical protein
LIFREKTFKFNLVVSTATSVEASFSKTLGFADLGFLLFVELKLNLELYLLHHSKKAN